jgi:hypothetical protein
VYSENVFANGHIGHRRGVFRLLVGKPEGKGPLGRPRRRLEDNIKMDIQEIKYGERHNMYILVYALCWLRVEVENFRKKNEYCCLLVNMTIILVFKRLSLPSLLGLQSVID